MTPIAHAAVGLIGWKYFAGRENPRALVFFTIAACAVDLDFLLYFLFGRPEVFIHQLYTHNVFVSLAVAAAFFPWLKSSQARWGLVLVALSHLVMDLFVIDTVPPSGFRPFFPVYNRFFGYGFFPYLVRDGLGAIFSLRNFVALACEVGAFVVPALIICRKEVRSLWRALWRKSEA